MIDITLCANKDCPLIDKCYRFQAKGSTYQSWSRFEPNENGECDHFMELRNSLHVGGGSNEKEKS